MIVNKNSKETVAIAKQTKSTNYSLAKTTLTDKLFSQTEDGRANTPNIYNAFNSTVLVSVWLPGI